MSKLVAILLAGATLALGSIAVRAESFEVVEFARPSLVLYEDKGGKAGKANTKIAADGVDRATSEFLDYDKKTRMFKVRLSGGEVGWLNKSSFKPLPKTSPLCTGTMRVASAPTGQSANSHVAAGQALAEELCL